MNSIVAISSAFLKGDILTIKTAFKDFGVTNLPRECGRSIERKFGVQLTKVRKEGQSRWGVSCTWFEYRLPRTPYNEEGRTRMIEYCAKNSFSRQYSRNQHKEEVKEEIRTELKSLGQITLFK